MRMEKENRLNRARERRELTPERTASSTEKEIKRQTQRLSLERNRTLSKIDAAREL